MMMKHCFVAISLMAALVTSSESLLHPRVQRNSQRLAFVERCITSMKKGSITPKEAFLCGLVMKTMVNVQSGEYITLSDIEKVVESAMGNHHPEEADYEDQLMNQRANEDELQNTAEEDFQDSDDSLILEGRSENFNGEEANAKGKLPKPPKGPYFYSPNTKTWTKIRF